VPRSADSCGGRDCRHRGSMRKLETVTTAFQQVAIWHSGSECEFRVTGATHAWWHKDRFLTGLAWDNMAAAALLRPGGPPRSLLMLGLAGGTSLRVLRHLLPELEITAVEIDREIVELARRHMRIDDLRVDIHFADAYQWLAQNRKRFDVIIDDVYGVTRDDVARPGAYDCGTRDALLRSMAGGGLLIANLVTGAGHRGLQSTFRRFFRAHFLSARSATTPAGANEALVGGDVVLSGRHLGNWTSRFAHPDDRLFWKRIRVRKL
jgi:Spermine/spermidine synthase domain